VAWPSLGGWECYKVVYEPSFQHGACMGQLEEHRNENCRVNLQIV
jgi:hypothetical protein